MAEAIDVVVDYFKQQEWNHDLDAEHQRLRSEFETELGDISLFVSAEQERKLCFVVSILPVRCPAGRRHHCAEVLSRLNYGMLLGCFEMDFDSGRIHFKTSAPFGESGLDPETVGSLVGCNLSMMKQCMEGILSVAFGQVSPLKAAERIHEGPSVKKPAKKSSTRSRRRFLNN